VNRTQKHACFLLLPFTRYYWANAAYVRIVFWNPGAGDAPTIARHLARETLLLVAKLLPARTRKILVGQRAPIVAKQQTKAPENVANSV
jgi:hypothetical protein